MKLGAVMMKRFLGLIGFGLSIFACAGGGHEDGTDESAGAVSGSCLAESSVPCTPTPGGELRKGIADLLRFSIQSDLAKNGVEPGDNDVKFVFKTLLVQHSHIYAAAQIMRGDGATPFDMNGTKFAGHPNTVQSLMEVESGSEFTHQIGISLDPRAFACDFFSANFMAQAPGIYQGNIANDCSLLRGSPSVDAMCFREYADQLGGCQQTSQDAPALVACMDQVKQNLRMCCVNGGTGSCADHQ